MLRKRLVHVPGTERCNGTCVIDRLVKWQIKTRMFLQYYASAKFCHDKPSAQLSVPVSCSSICSTTIPLTSSSLYISSFYVNPILLSSLSSSNTLAVSPKMSSMHFTFLVSALRARHARMSAPPILKAFRKAKGDATNPCIPAQQAETERRSCRRLAALNCVSRQYTFVEGALSCTHASRIQGRYLMKARICSPDFVNM